jgi:hypothetical protein
MNRGPLLHDLKVNLQGLYVALIRQQERFFEMALIKITYLRHLYLIYSKWASRLNNVLSSTP